MFLNRFYCRSDLPKYPLGRGGEKDFVVHFYLADDTVEVRELREEDGKVVLHLERAEEGAEVAPTKYVKNICP